jgi:hypothetical protein
MMAGGTEEAPIVHESGGYCYIPSLPFASAGVASLPGMAIVRGIFAEPQPLDRALDATERHLAGIGRRIDAVCGVELRMPEVLTWSQFEGFNTAYVHELEQRGLLRQGAPPFTRTNVVPAGSVAVHGVVALSYTVEADRSQPGFVISGTPEMTPGAAYPDNILRRGDTSREALLDKARCAVKAVQARIKQLGVTWDDACRVHLYSRWQLALDLRRLVLARIGVDPVDGIVVHDSEPPVFELELEVDVRSYISEVAIAG